MPVKSFVSRNYSRDSLSILIAPLESETPEERETRLQQAEEAKRVSNAIDEELKKERKLPKPMKILLLGQSESGKSTTLKNFQLMHTPKAFGKERASWRAVIYLNIVRSFHLIMDAMDRVHKNDHPLEEEENQSHSRELPNLTADHLRIRRRLSPLLQVELSLMNQLCPSSPTTHKGERRTPDSLTKFSLREITVNSTTQWKGFFGCPKNSSQTHIIAEGCGDSDPKDPGRLLHACCEDMVQLWTDPIIQELLRKMNFRLGDHADFFLNSLERVTAPGYLPTDDDILHARLKTIGVSEHRFRVDVGGGLRKDWRIYDVGGHRSQRAAWVPFFDDVDAVIFLAPISAYDQSLEEDPKVNRLLDSFQLWTSLVSNELLSRTNIILFLNKYDLFKTKIKAGIPLANYVSSYRDRSNDVKNASHYLRKQFALLMKNNAKQQRVFYCHFTTVTDTTSTKYILANLQDMLMRHNLATCDLT